MPLFHINLLLLLATSAVLLFVFINLAFEREYKALFKFLPIILINSAIWFHFLYHNGNPWIQKTSESSADFNSMTYLFNLFLIIGTALFILISLLKFFPKQTERSLQNLSLYDERDIMFARNNLSSHPDLYKEYYESNPGKREIDDPIHQKGNLSDPDKRYYDPYLTPVCDAAFRMLDEHRRHYKIETEPEISDIDPKKLSATLHYIGSIYGAVDIGITHLKPHHLYSHKGRHPEGWGKAVRNQHRYGIAIIVPMALEMIKKAPTIHTILESSKAYVESAKIAHLIETYLKGLGYDAKSHTDGNYETVCVPIAVDSGVGELSRMGLLIHDKLGPSIRIAIVTTNAPLIPTEGKTQHVDSFCRICKKCAENCPSVSIPNGSEPISRGFRHWTINQEKCFSFWKNIGTDCGFCLKVCPYSKPDTLFHRLVRFYISRNPINQRLALFFDDFLMGRRFKIPSSNTTN